MRYHGQDKPVFITRSANSKDDWETPPELFDPLNRLYRFNLDAAADDHNKLCKQYLGDALTDSWLLWWGEESKVWCNPPFSKKEDFIDAMLGYRQVIQHSMFLLPNNARETAWWNELVVPYADLIINLLGRVNFNYKGVPSKGCNFPTCLVVYRPRLLNVTYSNPPEITWDWKKGTV